MNKPQEWLSRDELIASARESGETITPHQLVRWHKEDLLPRPEPRSKGRGGGKGTTSYYPASAVLQAVFLSECVRIKRDLDHAAWRLWLAGFPVTARFRSALLRTLDQEIQRERGTVSAFKTGDPNNAIDRAARARPLREYPDVSPTNRPMLQRLLTETQLGVFLFNKHGVSDLVELFTQLGQPQLGDLVTSLSPDKINRFAKAEERERAPRTRARLEREMAVFSTVNLRAVVLRLSDSQLEADRARALDLWRTLTETSGLHLPLPESVFRLTIMARRMSLFPRLLLRDVGRGLRQQGYTSFREAMHDARTQSRNPDAQR